jgi:S-adenosylmethionine hydrolase
MPIITLTTDFGLSDWFVGTTRGVILGLNPHATVVDITHGIPPGDVRAGAFAFAASYRYFPKGTIHVAVVDPGVGSQRRAIAVRTTRYIFVGPDNGILSFALANERVTECREITNRSLFLKAVSSTFHGRDVFAPVAARLSKGMFFGRLGPALKHISQIDWPEVKRGKATLHGAIVYIDQFGNGITNFPPNAIEDLGGAECIVFLGRKRLGPLNSFYQAVPRGRPVAVIGSTGFLEIAVNGGSAADQLGLKIGQRVAVKARAAYRHSSS